MNHRKTLQKTYAKKQPIKNQKNTTKWCKLSGGLAFVLSMPGWVGSHPYAPSVTPFIVTCLTYHMFLYQILIKKGLKLWQAACLHFHNLLTLWCLGGFGNFRKKTAVFSCLTNALAPLPIALESCSTAQTDQPV